MKKNITTTNKNSKLILAKSKNLMNIANKVLAKKTSSDLVEDDAWMQRLWDWADANGIGDSEWLEWLHVEGGIDPDLDWVEKNGISDLELEDDGWMKWENWVGLARDKEVLLNLTNLQLVFSQFTELPKEIGCLTNLTSLTLFETALTELPKEICKLKNLTSIFLVNSELKKLPKEIGNLRNLTVLQLLGHELKSLPPEIKNLTNLTTLSLDNNPELTLTHEQRKWIEELKKNGCEIDR